MPQLDKYILLNQVITLIFFFFILYFYVRGTVVPNINKMLKYRSKKTAELIRHDKGNWRVFNQSNLRFSKFALNYLGNPNQTYPNISKILLDYKNNSIKQLNDFSMIYKNWTINKTTTKNKNQFLNPYLFSTFVISEITRINYYLNK